MTFDRDTFKSLNLNFKIINFLAETASMEILFFVLASLCSQAPPLAGLEWGLGLDYRLGLGVGQHLPTPSCTCLGLIK